MKAHGWRIALGWGLVAAAAAAGPAAEAEADIFSCVGPAGEMLYSNIGCPPGYSLRANTPEADAPAATPATVPTGQPSPQVPTTPPPEERKPVDEKCYTGTFQTEALPLGIDVLFTNLGARACRNVKFYCLWGLGAGMDFYQQSDTGSYDGLVEVGATVRVGAMTPTGPAAGDVSWSWCTIR